MCSPALLKSSVQRDRSLQQLVPTRTFSNSEGFLQCRIGQTSLKLAGSTWMRLSTLELGSARSPNERVQQLGRLPKPASPQNHKRQLPNDELCRPPRGWRLLNAHHMGESS